MGDEILPFTLDFMILLFAVRTSSDPAIDDLRWNDGVVSELDVPESQFHLFDVITVPVVADLATVSE